MKILVIEDSERLRRSLEHGLKRSGFTVDLVGDGESGLAHARLGTYDVIVLDLMLPLVDGLTVLRKLREGGDDTHVLILSALDQVQELSLLQAGDKIIIKYKRGNRTFTWKGELGIGR